MNEVRAFLSSFVQKPPPPKENKFTLKGQYDLNHALIQFGLAFVIIVSSAYYCYKMYQCRQEQNRRAEQMRRMREIEERKALLELQEAESKAEPNTANDSELEDATAEPITPQAEVNAEGDTALTTHNEDPTDEAEVLKPVEVKFQTKSKFTRHYSEEDLTHKEVLDTIPSKDSTMVTESKENSVCDVNVAQALGTGVACALEHKLSSSSVLSNCSTKVVVEKRPVIVAPRKQRPKSGAKKPFIVYCSGGSKSPTTAGCTIRRLASNDVKVPQNGEKEANDEENIASSDLGDHAEDREDSDCEANPLQ